MRIIISPAKKMNVDTDSFAVEAPPRFLAETRRLMAALKALSGRELQALWKCSDAIARQNVERLERMDLDRNLTTAILAYEGIQYRSMAPNVMEAGELDYLRQNLRILSGFYGLLRPFDGVTPYRLEMQAKAAVGGYKNLYEFWGNRLYQAVRDSSGLLINLASKEYSKCVERYLTEKDRFITITFCEESDGKLVTKGTYAKMARGDMVRFLAEEKIEEPEELKRYRRLGYAFREELSTETEYVFERIKTDT